MPQMSPMMWMTIMMITMMINYQMKTSLFFDMNEKKKKMKKSLKKENYWKW